MQSTAVVSVVIPTYARPVLLQRAVLSALRQTLATIEVIVVVDGNDEATLDVLSGIRDSRLRWVVNADKGGGSRSRNRGVREATAPWIAFLDDDDEWLPGKLQTQLEVATDAAVAHPVVSTQIVVRSDEGDVVWPRTFPTAEQPISEYLFCRSGLFSGDGQFQTSAILTSRELMIACPFNEAIRKHDDTEWYLTVAARIDTRFVVVAEPLTIWHQSATTARISQSGDWRESLAWARRCRGLMTPRAYASFLLSAVAAEAAGSHNIAGLWQAYGEAIRFGQPQAINLALPVFFLLVPRSLRHALRRVREGTRAGREPKGGGASDL